MTHSIFRGIISLIVDNTNLIDAVPTFPSYRRIKLSDKPMITRYLKPFPPFSEIIFSNLYDWRVNGLYTKFSKINGNLLIRACDVSTEKYVVWFVGTNKPDETILKLLSKYSKIHIPFYLLETFENIKDIEIIEDPNNHEYVYDVGHVLSMRSNKYEKFRRNVKKFDSVSSDYELKTLTNPKSKRDLYKKIEELFRSWSLYKSNGETDDYNTFFEFDSLKQYLIHSNLYNLTFIGLYKDTELCAFSTVEIDKSKNVAYVCYAKSNLSQRGISEFLFYKTAEFVQSKGIRYINFEQDLGIQNLRRYKEKLVPIEMYKSYIVKEK